MVLRRAFRRSTVEGKDQFGEGDLKDAEALGSVVHFLHGRMVSFGIVWTGTCFTKVFSFLDLCPTVCGVLVGSVIESP